MTLEQWLGEDNKLGQDIWHKKYQFNNESFDEWLDRVSGGNKALRQLILERKFLFGGRTLANRGTGKKGSFSNCYSRGFVDDSVEGLMQASTDIALTFKAQGGQGISLTNIRPKGCGINNGQYDSDGIVPFMELFNQTTMSISQGGSRKGALIMSLDIWHKEAEDFIKIKSEAGKIEKANLSLEIDDEFMKCVEKYYETGEVETVDIKREYNGNIVEYTVTPINLYKLMMEKAFDWAEPGCIFTNRFRNYNMMQFHPEYKIETCNPCFTGDMKLLTENGYMRFDELVDTEPVIYNLYGNKSKSKVWCSGEKDTVLVKLSNGKTITCTPDHKFMTNDGDECKAIDLKGKFLRPITNINKEFDEKYIKLGFIQGDGQLNRLNSKYHAGLEVNIGNLDGDIRDLFANEEFTIPSGDKTDRCIYLKGYNELLENLGFSATTLPERIFPTTYKNWTHLQKASFLHGCYSANGSVISKGRVAYKTTCKVFAEQLVETLKDDFNISAYITMNKAHKVKFRNGEYMCKESYDVNIGKYESLLRFITEINFYHMYKRERLTEMVRNKAPKVTSVIPLGKRRVYDFSEPIRHWGIVEGFIVHNCGEQPLPKHGACNLGSINLSEFVKNPFTSFARFDYDELFDAVCVAVEGLDEVLDENMKNHPLREQQEMAFNYRNVGLGIMGMHDFLIKMGVTYGSQISKELIDKVMYTMFRAAIIESSELAYKKGKFPKYDDCVLDSEIIKKHFTDEELEQFGIKERGLRNCSLLSIAPSGSIGTMLNISTGCEPLFQISYTRKTESLNGEDTYYNVYSGIAQEYINHFNTTELPDYFNTSSDINWHDRVDIQSILQDHIDTAISSTVNLPNEITQEEIEQLYLYAWKKGLKGVTIYRDGCKRSGILSVEIEKKNNKYEISGLKELPRGYVISVSDDLISYKRTIKTGCGKMYLHIDFDENTGEPLESWIDLGSGGGCERNLQFISRLISAGLRYGMPLSEVIEQAKSIRPCISYVNRTKTHGDTSPGTSCPGALGIALQELQNKINERCFVNEEEDILPQKESTEKKKRETKKNKLLCPECGEPLSAVGGCFSCTSCSYSKCE